MQHILRIIACESDNVFIKQRVENAMLHSEHSIFNVLAERKKVEIANHLCLSLSFPY